MNVGEVSLRDLEYLVAVAEELHFGKAAHRVHVSQPTLSEQIKKLEAQLEIKFFERSNRSVKLTPIGAELIEIARHILRESEVFIKMASKKRHPLSGEFHLGAIATVGPYYLPFILGPLRKTFPELELVVHEGMTDELLELLDRGELNAIIASRTFDEKKYRVYSLFKEPFWLAAPAEQSVKLKNGKFSVRDVDREKLILLKEGNCLKDEVLNFCSLTKSKVTSHFQATSLETLRYLVASGNGYTFFPELAVREDKKLKDLIRYYPFSEKTANREIVLVTREQYSKPEEIRLLYQKLKDCLPVFEL